MQSMTCMHTVTHQYAETNTTYTMTIYIRMHIHYHKQAHIHVDMSHIVKFIPSHVHTRHVDQYIEKTQYLITYLVTFLKDNFNYQYDCLISN